MTTIHQVSKTRPSIRDSFISAIISILVIGMPFVLFIIPLSTKNTVNALDSLNHPQGQWELIEKNIQKDSILTPEGTAKAEYVWGGTIDNSLASEFNNIAEIVTGDEISSMQVTKNYHYSCIDDANTCTVAYTKDFGKNIGKHTVIVNRIKDADKETLYPDQKDFKTLLSITVSEQPYQA